MSYIPIIEKPLEEKYVLNLNPLSLAFIGDAVHNLFVRADLVANNDVKANKLHLMTSKNINAKSQAVLIDNLMDNLNETEIAIFKRARNAHSATVPKNASVSDYHKSTGFEAILGYLYLTGRSERLEEILKITDN